MPEPIPLNRKSGRVPLRSSVASSSHRESEDDFTTTPVLPPVARSKQARVLLSSFLAVALTIGFNQCSGVFQEYYLSPSQTLLQPAPASMRVPPTAQLALVGTLGAGLTWAGSIFVNPLVSRIEYLAGTPDEGSKAHAILRDGLRYHWHRLLRCLTPRQITLAGVVLMSLGFLLASFSHTVVQLILTQGLLYGLGSSLLYFPLLSPAPEYFTAHRATALGIILSGGGAGGLVLSPALRALLSAVDGAWTLRILAAAYLLVGTPVAWSVPPSRFPVVPAAAGTASPGHRTSAAVAPAALESAPISATLTAPAVSQRRRTHISASLAATPVFLLSASAAFCQSAGAQLPITFIPSYSVALGFSAARAATLLAAANAVNAVARVVSGYAGDKLGRLNALVISLVVAFAAVTGLWLGSAVVSGEDMEHGAAPRLWLSFIVLYSVAAGGYYALFPATIADVFGIRSYAAVNGFIYFVRGCGTILGSPVGGALLGETPSGPAAKGYASVVLWDGALLLGSVLCIVGVRWADARRRGWVWRA